MAEAAPVMLVVGKLGPNKQVVKDAVDKISILNEAAMTLPR